MLENHDLNGCADRVIASPAACRRVLQALTRAPADGTLDTDPKWRPTQAAAQGLVDAITAPRSRVTPARR